MIICLLLQGVNLVGAPNAEAAKKPKLSPASVLDLSLYWNKADIVVEGRVARIESDTRTTLATIVVDTLYKGEYTDDSLVVRTNRGKILVSEEDADFRSQDHAVLFLQDLGDGVFACVDGLHGKKNILNDNIYFDAEDPFKTAKIKEYREAMQRIKKNGLLTNE